MEPNLDLDNNLNLSHYEDIIIPIMQFTDQLVFHSGTYNSIYFLTKTYLSKETQNHIANFFEYELSNNFKKYHRKHFPNPKHYRFTTKGRRPDIIVAIMNLPYDVKVIDYNFGGEIVKVKVV